MIAERIKAENCREFKALIRTYFRQGYFISTLCTKLAELENDDNFIVIEYQEDFIMNELYKEKIIEMVKGINNQKSINLVYGFVNRIYGEDRAYYELTKHNNN